MDRERSAPSTPVTELLHKLSGGETEALDQLIPILYDELRTLARKHLRSEAPGHTLQTTALVNEAYLRLARERQIDLKSRVQFFGVASSAMRRVLVDYARRRKSQKRGEGRREVPLEEAECFLSDREADEILALDRALVRLSELNPRAGTVVQHRFFSGLTLTETAELLDVSLKTVQRDWMTARAWLLKEIGKRLDVPPGI